MNIQDYTDISLFETLGIIGDSFACGRVYPSGKGIDKHNISWGQILARKHGIKAVTFACGGLTTETWLSHERGLDLLLSEDAKQLYIIALGINDTSRYDKDHTYLGSVSDISTEYYNINPPTFYGNMGRIISNVLNHAPNGKIVLSTIPRTDKDSFAIINDAIIEIANTFKLPYVVSLEDPFFSSAFFLDNKVMGHPTAPLHSGMANAYTRLLNNCMFKHCQYFMEYYG